MPEPPPVTRDLAWVDGRIVDATEPALPVTDRAFQLGDGVFETLRVRRGVAIEWAEHYSRLCDSARALAILPPAEAGLLAGLASLLAASGLDGGADARADEAGAVGDASVRLTVSRGAMSERGSLPGGWSTATPTVVIQVWPFRPPPAAVLERGIRAIVSSVRRDPTSPLAGVKSVSRAETVLARLQAERAGADDALHPSADGGLAEATSSNLFAVTGRRVVTPPVDAGVLVGTTRTWLLNEGIASEGLEPAEGRLTLDDLRAADEAFLSSSVAGIVPLVEVDARPVGNGRPGPVTRRLRERRERWIEGASLAARRADLVPR